MATTAGAVALDIVAGKNTVSGTVKDAMNDVKNQTSSASAVVSKRMGEIGDSCTKLGKGLLPVSGAITGVGIALVGATESSRDYRTEMSKLETAFKTENYSAETAKKTYQDLQAVLGETEQAVEATNHLAKLCKSEEQLSEWTEICTGVYATFGASLPIEGLTEAANETAKVGAVTGPLADALNWAGISEEEFNLKLEACNNEQERAALITQTLTDTYKDAADTYKETAGDIMDANRAQERLAEATARVGEAVEPVVTQLTNFAADALTVFAAVLEAFNDLPEPIQTTTLGILGIVAIAGPLLMLFGSVATSVSSLIGLFGGAGAAAGAAGAATAAGGAAAAGGIGAVVSAALPVVAVIAGVVAAGVLLYKNWDTIKEKGGELKEWTVTKFSEMKEGVTTRFDEMKTSVGEKVTAFSEELRTTYAGTIAESQGLFSSFKDFTGLIFEETKVAALGPVAAMCQLITGDIEGAKETSIDTLTRLKENGSQIMESFKDLTGKTTSLIKTAIKEDMGGAKESAIKSFENMRSGVSEKVGKIKSSIVDGFGDAVGYITSLPGKAYGWGKDIVDNIVKGIRGAIKNVSSAASDVASAIRSYLHFTVPDIGPLSDFDTYMPDMMGQLSGGMLAGIPAVENAANKVAGVMARAIMPTPALANVGGGYVGGSDGVNNELISMIKQLLDDAGPRDSGGDIIIPVYVGNESIDTMIVKAEQIRNYRSGGRG